MGLWSFILWMLGFSENYMNNISYRVYDSNAANSMYTWKSGGEDFSKLTCPTNGPLAYVFTGFGENDGAAWVKDIVTNLKTYRTGCVVLVDYWKYTNVELTKYPEVALHFDGIIKAVATEVVAFNKRGFTAANTLFFGFSIGAQVALAVGREVSSKIGGKVARVDACDPTSLGIPVAWTKDSTLSAVNVQCIHTNSLFFGTTKRDCHQDWNMGNCGLHQTINVNITSHLQCPMFYNSAFKNDFPAMAKPAACVTPAKLGVYDVGYKMGYTQTKFPQGEFYAKTSLLSPYN